MKPTPSFPKNFHFASTLDASNSHCDILLEANINLLVCTCWEHKMVSCPYTYHIIILVTDHI